LKDLKANLIKLGSDLLILSGQVEEVSCLAVDRRVVTCKVGPRTSYSRVITYITPFIGVKKPSYLFIRPFKGIMYNLLMNLFATSGGPLFQ